MPQRARTRLDAQSFLSVESKMEKLTGELVWRSSLHNGGILGIFKRETLSTDANGTCMRQRNAKVDHSGISMHMSKRK